MKKFWVGIICFVGGLTLGFIGAAYWAYWAAGSVIVIGGAIQAAMRHKAKKVVNFSPNGSKPTEPKIRFGKDIHSKYNRGH